MRYKPLKSHRKAGSLSCSKDKVTGSEEELNSGTGRFKTYFKVWGWVFQGEPPMNAIRGNVQKNLISTLLFSLLGSISQAQTVFHSLDLATRREDTEACADCIAYATRPRLPDGIQQVLDYVDRDGEKIGKETIIKPAEMSKVFGLNTIGLVTAVEENQKRFVNGTVKSEREFSTVLHGILKCDRAYYSPNRKPIAQYIDLDQLSVKLNVPGSGWQNFVPIGISPEDTANILFEKGADGEYVRDEKGCLIPSNISEEVTLNFGSDFAKVVNSKVGVVARDDDGDGVYSDEINPRSLPHSKNLVPAKNMMQILRRSYRESSKDIWWTGNDLANSRMAMAGILIDSKTGEPVSLRLVTGCGPQGFAGNEHVVVHNCPSEEHSVRGLQIVSSGSPILNLDHSKLTVEALHVGATAYSSKKVKFGGNLPDDAGQALNYGIRFGAFERRKVLAEVSP